MSFAKYVSNLRDDFADDGMLNNFRHADTFQKGLSQGKFTPQQLAMFEQASGGRFSAPVQKKTVTPGQVGVGEITTQDVPPSENAEGLLTGGTVKTSNNPEAEVIGSFGDRPVVDTYPGIDSNDSWESAQELYGDSLTRETWDGFIKEFNRLTQEMGSISKSGGSTSTPEPGTRRYDGLIRSIKRDNPGFSEAEVQDEFTRLYGADDYERLQGERKDLLSNMGFEDYGAGSNAAAFNAGEKTYAFNFETGEFEKRLDRGGWEGTAKGLLKESLPIAAAVASGNIFGPTLAQAYGGGIAGAAGAGATLSAGHQLAFDQELDPEGILMSAVTSGATTGLDQFLNDGVINPGLGLDDINVQGARDAAGRLFEDVFGGATSLETVTDVSTGEVLGDRVNAGQFIDDAGRLQDINQFNHAVQTVTSQPVLGQALDTVSNIPGVTEGATYLAEALNPELRLKEEVPESVIYPNETFADPTGELSTDPLTEEIMQDAFDPGSVDIVEGSDGEFVFVENDPKFSPDEISQIGVPELEPDPTEGEGGGGNGDNTDPAEDEGEVVVDGDLDEEEDIFVDTVNDTTDDIEDIDDIEEEEVVVDPGDLDDVGDEEVVVEPGDLDDDREEQVVVDTASGSSGSSGLSPTGMLGGEHDPFMANILSEFEMLQRLGISPSSYLADTMRRAQ